MKNLRTLCLVALSSALVACGEPTVIDIVKDSSVAECSAATVGSMLILYFPTTNWTAYNGETAGTYEIRGAGELQYVGATQTAELKFLYDETTGQVTYTGASLNGIEQPSGVAQQIIRSMCDEARN